MPRRAKQLQRLEVNGWLVDKMPNSFAERFAWEVKAVCKEGYLIEQHGFFSKTKAVQFATESKAPTEKVA